MYGDILAQYIIKPEVYELWSRRNNNVFISPEASSDIVDHYELVRGDVISFYTLNKKLLVDRDFAELHGLDTSDDEVLMLDLDKLGFINRLGFDYSYETDYSICCDHAKTVKGEDVVVMMIVDTY